MEAVVKRNVIELQARSLVDAMIYQHSIRTIPRVLFWRNLVIEVFPHKADEWRRDCNEVREHLNRHFGFVRVMLEVEGVLSLKVSGEIKKWINHGETPYRDDNRNDGFYCDCIPASSRPAVGIVCFPKNTCEDHPLVVATLKRRGSEAANRFVNQVDTLSTFRDNGIVSQDIAGRIGGSMAERAMPAMQMHPDAQPQRLEHRDDGSHSV